jgi:hypothetical protein
LYGSNPIVYAQIIEDLQTTHIAEARVDSKNISVEKLLIAMNFLKCYQSEEVRSGQFRVSEKTARKWGWFYSKKIQALKEQKIVWPESWNDGHPLLQDNNTPIFLVSLLMACIVLLMNQYILSFPRIPSTIHTNTTRPL